MGMAGLCQTMVCRDWNQERNMVLCPVLVEHTIGRLKRYARLADPYDGNAAGFNREFNVITGLVNLNIVGLHGKGSATAGAVEDVSRLGQGLLRSSGQVEFRAR